MEPWWIRNPDVLETEKSALDNWGQPWSLDEIQFAAGRLVVRITTPVGGDARELTAFYPDSYPYFMPQVQLRQLRLPKHHNPEGYLCLLADDGAEWRPGQDTLAGLLQEQLPRLESVTEPHADPDFVAENEDHVGEPLANYLPYMERSAILVPDDLPAGSIRSGGLRLLARQRSGPPGSVAILKQITDDGGQPVVDFPIEMPAFKQQTTGFWRRLQERPPIDGLNEDETRTHLYNLALSGLPAFQKRLRIAKKDDVFVLALLYPDEVRWREAAEDWVFIWVKVAKAGKGGRNPSAPSVEYGLVRADWAGDKSLLMRAPSLAPLRSKSVLLVGLGAIGSPLAIQFAKSGIREMHLLDMDHLQAGNTVRWALGWSLAGYPKAEVIASHLLNEFPRTKVYPVGLRIGGARVFGPGGEPFSDYDFLRELTARVDLVVDATANYRVNHLLADITRRENKTYLWLSTTPGAAGGVVGRVIPGRTAGCWHCCQHALRTGVFKLPADNGAANVQPQGCTYATFIAAGLDSDEVPILASRLAVATLLAQDGEAGQESDFSWDIAVGDFFEGERRIAARWMTYPLKVHPECDMCASGV